MVLAAPGPAVSRAVPWRPGRERAFAPAAAPAEAPAPLTLVPFPLAWRLPPCPPSPGVDEYLDQGRTEQDDAGAAEGSPALLFLLH